ncbi:Calcineurin-like phosphoesterase domain, ApaH type [uncultured Caudovirales phage]|uniref:Calcineurin-like phosphoesterase domain, ApaH type n=1 Tax=uncultured Caudovirales phage TaxID=2100421 RepID=A0A6J7WUR3_9CAUD|nr:Calcineurin-like phosphoesterase domain, ApaH type [uncultured Caudovirales phage]
MKISVCSDVHLEFGDLDLRNKDNADVLILSGDILVAHDLGTSDTYEIISPGKKHMSYLNFMEQVCKEFKHVVYVVGNHEHYHGDFNETIPKLKSTFGHLVNLHILEKESVLINDVMFIGGTLWTDMNKEDPMTLAHIRGVMNDFKIIDDVRKEVHYRDEDGNSRTRTGRFSPIESVNEHKQMLSYVKTILEENATRKCVVVGHHAPSKLSTHPRYATEVIVNGAYSSDLSEFILDHPQVKLWTHGHTHEVFDYNIGSTRIVCNPRGYINYEDRADQFELITVEI